MIADHVGTFFPRDSSTLKKLEISKSLQPQLNPPGFRGKSPFRGQFRGAYHARLSVFYSWAARNGDSRCTVDRHSAGAANAWRNYGRGDRRFGRRASQRHGHVDRRTDLTDPRHQNQRRGRVHVCESRHRHLHAHLHGRGISGAEDPAHHGGGRPHGHFECLA